MQEFQVPHARAGRRLLLPLVRVVEIARTFSSPKHGPHRRRATPWLQLGPAPGGDPFCNRVSLLSREGPLLEGPGADITDRVDPLHPDHRALLIDGDEAVVI